MPRPESPSLIALYDRMDRLEELLEDMDELGVVTREDAERLIRELDEQIDAQESGKANQS